MEQDEIRREAERVDLLVEIARDLQSNGTLPEPNIILNEARVRLATKAYFVLNDAYHRWRIEPGHNTQPPKIAAMQALCIIRVQPFRVLYPDNATTIAEARPNEIFALAIAMAILKIDMQDSGDEKTNQRLRILELLCAYECDSFEAVIEDANYRFHRERKDYNCNILDVDKPKIDSLITIFELMAEVADLRSKH